MQDNIDDLKQQPARSRQGTTAVDTADMLEDRRDGQLDADGRPGAQTINRNNVQEPQEQLVAHENGTQQVAQDQRAQVVVGIGKVARGGQDDAREVEERHKNKEAAVRVEPEPEKDPAADLELGLGGLLGRVLFGVYDSRRR